MSTAARREAIDIITRALGEQFVWIVRVDPDSRPLDEPEPDRALEIAATIVDRLLETHAISRRAPRLHRAAKPRPRRALDGLRRVTIADGTVGTVGMRRGE
jgi:hypothetical protein